MAISEVRPDQRIEDGQENANGAPRAHETEARSSAEKNLAHEEESAATLAQQAAELETPSAELNDVAAGEEESETEATEGEAEANGAGVLAADQAAMPPSPFATENLPPEQNQEKPQGFFRRRVQSQELKKLKAENEKIAGELESARDRYVRLAAEMENFRKRTERDFYVRVQAEVARLVGALLPLVDDLERCLSAKAEAQDYEALKNGVALIHQKFGKVLGSYGVKPMTAVGEAFDPNLHDALAIFAREDRPSGIVLEEHSKGYMIGDKVLRPAQVLVSQ